MAAVPKWMGKVNKKVFNPREIRKGKRPVLIHTGRSSGATYFTPLDAHEVDDGFVFIVMYGSDCDWVQNVLHAGTATLRVKGSEFELGSPRLISIEDAAQALQTATDDPPKLRTKAEYLRMDRAG